jgi:ABC-type phosphate transport system permease subunit
MEFLAGLPTVSAGILALVFLLIVFQEAVNGFHDTITVDCGASRA